MGKTYFSLTTKEGVNHYLEHRKKDVESGLIVKGRYTTIKTHLQHFLDFIGKNRKLKELERIDCEDYFYERMKKSKNNVKQVTIQNEQSTINSCMKFLFRKNETHFEAFDFKKLPKVDRNNEAIRRARLLTKNINAFIKRCVPTVLNQTRRLMKTNA
jgi:site-specific recombinase XerD